MRLFTLIAALTLVACQPSSEAGSPAPDPIVLTVFSPSASGAAPQTGLFERYVMTGPAQSFTLQDLAGLEGFEIDTAYPSSAPQQTWRGPRLSAVLAAAGAPGAGARLTALDGYTVEVGAAAIAQMEPILAISAEGQGLTLGGLGPVMVIWPEAHPGPDDEAGASDWIWSVFALEAVMD